LTWGKRPIFAQRSEKQFQGEGNPRVVVVLNRGGERISWGEKRKAFNEGKSYAATKGGLSEGEKQ